MQIPPLDDATLASVRKTQAHRYPQTATVLAPADRGAGSIKISLVIGNPSGSCSMPAGSFISPAWSQFVLSALSADGDPPGMVDLLARDVVIWPSADVVDEMLNAWPALSQPLASILGPKIGMGYLHDPKPTEKPPAYVAEALVERPRASWRWARPARGAAFTLLVEPPDAGTYTVFVDEVKRAKTDAWSLTRRFVDATTPIVFDPAGVRVSLDGVIARWPGLAISLAKDAARLGGISAQVELGE